MMASNKNAIETAPAAMSAGEPAGVWWGVFDVDTGACSTHRIGPLDLSVERTVHEWQIVAVRAALEPELADDPGVARQTPVAERFAFETTTGPLCLMPVMADRPVITRPSSPFYVAPGGAVTIYMSSPMWVRVAVGRSATLLQELYIVRPSDTWFGPSTREGELCYASRTAARMTPEELPLRPERAVTAAHIRNQTAKSLLLERISLPTAHLALYAAPNGQLWTQDMTLLNEGEQELSHLMIENVPPRHAPDASLVTGARSPVERKTLVRAFATVFK